MSSKVDKDILRYAFGTSLALLISIISGGMLDYILPVLLLPFLASKTELSLMEGLSFVGAIALAVLFANMVVLVCLEYPGVLLAVIFLVAFSVYYSKNKYMSANMKTWLIISVLLVPNIAIQSVALAEIISTNLVTLAIECIVIAWICYYFFPASGKSAISKSESTEAVNYTRQDFDRALIRTLVITPVILLFYSFDMTSYLLILIFIAILSMQAGFGADFKAGKALIIGNLIGGIMSIAFYEIYTLIPMLTFLIISVTFIGLIIGKKLFSDLPIAPLFGMAFSTFILIIGSSTGGGDSTANTKVWIRVLQIMAAVIYVALSFSFIERWRQYFYETR